MVNCNKVATSLVDSAADFIWAYNLCTFDPVVNIGRFCFVVVLSCDLDPGEGPLGLGVPSASPVLLTRWPGCSYNTQAQRTLPVFTGFHMSDLQCARVWAAKIKKQSHRNVLLYLASQANDHGFVVSSAVMIKWAIDVSKSHAYKMIRELADEGSLELIKEVEDADDEDAFFKLWRLNLGVYDCKEAVSDGTLSIAGISSAVSEGTLPMQEAVSDGTVEDPPPKEYIQTPLPPQGASSSQAQKNPLETFSVGYSGSYFPDVIHHGRVCASMAVGQWEKGAPDKPAVAFLALNTRKTFDGLRELLRAIVKDINMEQKPDRQIGKLAELFMLVFGPERFKVDEVFKRVGKMYKSAGTPANCARRIMYFLIDEREFIDDPYLALQHSITKKAAKYSLDWWMENDNLVFLREGDRNKAIRMRKDLNESQFVQHGSEDGRTTLYTHESQKARVKRFKPAPVPVANPQATRTAKVR